MHHSTTAISKTSLGESDAINMSMMNIKYKNYLMFIID